MFYLALFVLFLTFNLDFILTLAPTNIKLRLLLGYGVWRTWFEANLRRSHLERARVNFLTVRLNISYLINLQLFWLFYLILLGRRVW